jgi:hypothetical protein
LDMDSGMSEPRRISLSMDAVDALLQILGIMGDQLWSGAPGESLSQGWDFERLIALEYRLQSGEAGPDPDTSVVTLDITDVSLLLEGMAFTEVASAELPWVEMVRWTADFVTAELRHHWPEELWRRLSSSN